MPRVPYQLPKPGESEIADDIRKRRKGDLIELDGVLLNAPHLAGAINGMGQAIRIDSTVSADLRELAILRVAALNGAAYEWIKHVEHGKRAGLTLPQLAVIRDVSNACTDKVDPESVLSEVQRACLMYTDSMTRDIRVPQPIFDALHALLNDQHLVELTGTIGCYNMVSRILVTLDVGDMGTDPVPEVPIAS